MKKTIASMLIILGLTACEDASKAVDNAQASANKAVDSLQEKLQTLDLDTLNLDQFAGAANSGKQLVESVQDAVDVDFNSEQAIEDAKQHVAQAYRCVIDATSESTAEQLINKIKASISDDDVLDLIDRSVEKAKAATACVMQ